MTIPIITLCTDFGTVDGYVAQMKGIILSICVEARIVDMTHDIPPQDVRAGAYLIGTAAPRFPPGTLHLAVVDPGVGGERRGMILLAAGQIFVGPDNGLFSAMLDAAEAAYEIVAPPNSSKTFHGRDLFAPVAARIAAGGDPTDMGTPLHDPVSLEEWIKTINREGAEGRVTHIDRFGNAATNLRPEDFPNGLKRMVVQGKNVPDNLPILETYCQVELGCALWLVGSGGFYELAMRNASASGQFSIQRGDVVLGTP